MDNDCIEKQINLRAPIEKVWKALSNSNEFGAWFGMRFDGPFVPGSPVSGTISPTKVNAEVAAAQKPLEGMPVEITIEKMEPERLFSFRWHPFAIDRNVDYSGEPTTLIEFSLEKSDDGVKLTVTECGFDQIPLERRAKAFAANDQSWSKMVKVLEEYVLKTS